MPNPMPSNIPEVSIIVPVFNGEREFRACLDSIYRCLHVDYEVIVVDDGSTDRSLSIAQEYPCRIIALNENRGPAFARNRGIEVSRARYLLFTDHDCIVSRQWALKAYRAFHRLKKRDPLAAGAEGRGLPLKGFFNKCDAYCLF